MVSIELQNICKSFLLDKKEKDYSIFDRILKLAGLKKKARFIALKDINLKFYENEIVGILGENGAGKTTLVNIMYGITIPTSGRVVSEKKITALYGYGGCFNGELTGRQNIYLSGTAYGIRKKDLDRNIDKIIAFSEIKEIDIQLKYYSNGMKARLGFSIFSFIDSDILIFDESLVGGDFFFQNKCALILQEMIKRPHKTFFIISHDEGSLINLCNRIIVLKNGDVVFDGNPLKALEYYKSTKIVSTL